MTNDPFQFLFDTLYIIYVYFQNKRVQGVNDLLLFNKVIASGWLIIDVRLHYNRLEIKGT